MDYTKIHQQLADEFGLTLIHVQHIRSACTSRSWNKQQYEDAMRKRLTDPKRKKGKNGRKHGITWYLAMIKFVTSISEEKFEHIVTFK